MRCYRRILKVCWKDRIHNEVIREKVNRCHTIMDVIKHRKLQLFGHICRMRNHRVVKLVTLGMTGGNRPRGRPTRRWSDDIADWCGCTVPEAVHMANDRDKWRTITGLNGPHGSWVHRERDCHLLFLLTLFYGHLLAEVTSYPCVQFSVCCISGQINWLIDWSALPCPYYASAFTLRWLEPN